MFKILDSMGDVFLNVSIIDGWQAMASEFEVDYTCDQIARGSTTSSDNSIRASDSTEVIGRFYFWSFQNRSIPNGLIRIVCWVH